MTNGAQRGLRAVPVIEPKASAGPRNGNGYLFYGERMRSIQATLRQLARSDVPVVFQGETGSGKEVLARELHLLSPRASRPFLKLNCAAVPLELLESELFGYERGAFTGASATKPGKFELAGGGSMLLDEVGDMDVKLQAKLLHVLQDSEFQRLGGTETIRVDVRVLTATHRDLRQEIAAGRFREDLYYRLNVVTVDVPPLRERRDEILALARYFLEKHATTATPVPALNREVASALVAYGWPGNVRELENVMRRLLVFPDQVSVVRELAAESAGGHDFSLRGVELSAGSADEVVVPTLTEVAQERGRAESSAILAALDRAHWNRRRAAALLNVDYKGLLYRMKKLGLDKNPAAALLGKD
jgi:two-component system response regulator AtoC